MLVVRATKFGVKCVFFYLESWGELFAGAY